MDETNDIQTWGTRENLSQQIINTLEENGFNSLDDLKQMNLSDIKECFHKEGLLNLQQCLALRNALARFQIVLGFPSESSNVASSDQMQPNIGPQGSYDTMCLDTLSFGEPGVYASSKMTTADGNFRFLLLGKTGSGKSTTGNTIFGKELFNTDATFSSVTTDCERKTSSRKGQKIEIIDSPGLYDTHKSHEEICVTIVQAVAGMHPGPHAILYVVRLGRYTAEEHGAYKRLKALFDGNITKYMIVLFTHGDMLERKNRSIEDVISGNTPKELQEVLRECSNRYVVFNNVGKDRDLQVDDLLERVRQLERANNGQPYSCPKYSKIGEGMEEEVARRIQEVEKRDLKRQKYVQQLEQQTRDAETTLDRTREEFKRNEEERRRKMKEEEEKREKLEEKLHTQMEENQRQIQQHQERLEKARKEREEQERMLREKEHEMTEERRKVEEKNAELMKKKEEEMEDRMRSMEHHLAQQMKAKEEEFRQFENEKQELEKQLRTQQRQEIEQIERKQAEMERLHKEKEEREQESKEEEMEKLKQDIVDTTDLDAIDMLVNGAATVVRGFTRLIVSALE